MDWVFWFFFLVAFLLLLFTWPAGDDTADFDRIHAPFDQDAADHIAATFAPVFDEHAAMIKASFVMRYARDRGFYYVLEDDE